MAEVREPQEAQRIARAKHEETNAQLDAEAFDKVERQVEPREPGDMVRGGRGGQRRHPHDPDAHGRQGIDAGRDDTPGTNMSAAKKQTIVAPAKVDGSERCTAWA